MSSADNPPFHPAPPEGGLQPSLPLASQPFPPPPVFIPKAGENPLWSGWDVLLIAALTLGILFLTQLSVVFAVHRFVYPHESWGDLAQKPALALVAEFAAYIVVGLYMVLLIEVKYHARFWSSLRWKWPGPAGISFIGIGVLMLGFDLLGRFLPMPGISKSARKVSCAASKKRMAVSASASVAR